MPRILMVMSMIDDKIFLMEDQNEYWLGVRMLWFPMKHSRPDIINASRKLSEANDSAKSAAFKELLCVIKYVLDIIIFV